VKVIIVTDAWYPQVNGVVRTYENTSRELQRRGIDVLLITPDRFKTLPCPTYPAIRLALHPGLRLGKMIRQYDADAVHVATEGPLGHAARSFCMRHNIPFTTSFHTQFPEYIRMRIPFPLGWSYAYLRHFHAPARYTFVPTPSLAVQLSARGFGNTVVWGRGVDTRVFLPAANLFSDLPRPVFINAGRVAVEKNITAFLDLELPGSKVIVGDGPDLKSLQTRYPHVLFMGLKQGNELAACLASADVFVFPSLTDTFGIVMLESMACGVPVAAYPVTGPSDVIRQGITGILDTDLRKAAMAALTLDKRECLEFARSCSWQHCTDIFLNHLTPISAAA